MKQSSVIQRFAQLSALAILVVSLAGLGASVAPKAISAPDGEQTFKASCVACHAGGGNIVDPKKPLKGSKVLASKDAFKAYLTKPSGAMLPFPQIANDAPTLAALYSYCRTLK